MRLSFVVPSALLLLLLLVPLWAVALLVPRRLSPGRFWASLLARSALIAALVLAIAGTQIVRGTDSLTTVFLIDSSDSVSPSARGQAEAFVQDALRTMPPEDRAAVVVFGENALVERTPSDEPVLGRLTSVPVAARTNLESAMQLGLALLPADTRKRLVLLSDGGQNTGDALETARLAAARGVPVSYVDLSRPSGNSGGEALIASLTAPSRVHAGQEFDLTVQIESTVAQQAGLDLFVGDRLLGSYSLHLPVGTTSQSLRVKAAGQGFQHYRAQLRPQIDSRAQNNQYETLVHTTGQPRVLLVEGQPGEARNLADALAAAQINAETILPDQLPTDLTALSNYDTVALVNVPARDLPVKAVAVLPTYVRDLGRGLVIIGGDRSFGVGGYGRTPIEDALPVYTDVRDRQERPDLALVFIIDKSGSMDACHCAGPNGSTAQFKRGGVPKVDIAKDAVVQASSVLRERDTVGVVAFDSGAHWILTPQRGPTSDAIQRAVSPLLPEGGTNVRAGLQAAEDALDHTEARIKHAILLTDGWSGGGDNLEIAKRMREKGITLSVIAAGSGSADVLKNLADEGGGRYYPAANMEEVPQIFVQETITAVGNYLVEEPFTPRYASPSPLLDGLQNGLPQLYGYNGTTLKESASLVLAGVDDAPVLAQWQYGLGRSVAWTSDAKGKWGRDWVTWQQFPRFVAQMVDWTLPTLANGLDAQVRNEGGQTVVDVRATDQGGKPRDSLSLRATLLGQNGQSGRLTLTQTGPGAYHGTLASPLQGTYVMQIVGAQDGTVVAQDTIGVVVPYSAEYRLGQSNPALLQQIAQVSAGTRLEQPEDAFKGGLPEVAHAQEIGLPLLLLALLLLPLDIGLRRFIWKRT